MPRRSKFIPQNTEKGWCINIPPAYSASGKRERHFYPTREKAKAAAAILRNRQENFGINATAISPTLASQATQAEAILAPFGVSILDAAKHYAAIAKRAAESCLISEATASFMERKTALGESQAKAYRLVCDALVEDFGERMIMGVTGQELAEHLEKRTGGPGAYNQKIRLVRAIWRWAAKPPRKWTETDAVDELELKESGDGVIEVLTSQQAETLMRTMETYFPECVPAFAISLFTGIRKAELERLTPEDITADGITVPAKISRKRKKRRFIHMIEPLAAWLSAYPIDSTVLPANWSRKEKAARRLAGWKVWSDHVPLMNFDPPMEETPPEDAPEWPHNALRHTAATLALAVGKPIESLVFEHGHAGGLETLRSHYIGLMPKREAIAILALRPQGLKTR